MDIPATSLYKDLRRESSSLPPVIFVIGLQILTIVKSKQKYWHLCKSKLYKWISGYPVDKFRILTANKSCHGCLKKKM